MTIAARSRGITLVEVLVIVVILGVIAAVAIPKLESAKDKENIAAVRTDLANLVVAQGAFFATNGRYSASLDSLKAGVTHSVVLTIHAASTTGWSANSFHPATWPHTCAVFAGTAPVTKPAASPGVIACD